MLRCASGRRFFNLDGRRANSQPKTEVGAVATMSLPTSIISIALNTVHLVSEAAKALQGLVERFRLHDPGDGYQIDCRQLQLQLEVDVAKTMSWYNLWFLDTDKSDDLFQALWGQAGHGAILLVLQSISAECETLKNSVKTLIERVEAQLRKSKPRRSDSWKKLSRILQLPTKWKADANLGKEIHDEVHALTGHIDDLWEKSQLHFRRLHGIPRGQENLADTAYANARIDYAVATRPKSCALYWALRPETAVLELELNFNHDREFDLFSDLFDWADLRLSYHVSLETPNEKTTWHDLIIELWENEGLVEGRAEHEIKSLIAILGRQPKSPVSDFVLKVPGSAGQSEFNFRLRCETYVHRKLNSAPLPHAWWESKDPSLSQTNANIAPRETKMTLAYRLVECSMFLLGTPWLFQLSSDSLRLFGATEHDFQYSLQICLPSKNAIPDSPCLDSEATQIFNIGVILVEIALGCRFLPDAPKNMITESMGTIERLMGSPYRQACEFCLKQKDVGSHSWVRDSHSGSSPSSSTPYIVQMTSHFYSEVFMR